MQDLQQDDMLFRVRYKLVTVESAADKAAGQVTKDESKVFQATIDILENKLSTAKADSELLADQSKTSFNELSKILMSSLKPYLVSQFYFTASLSELGARSSQFKYLKLNDITNTKAIDEFDEHAEHALQNYT